MKTPLRLLTLLFTLLIVAAQIRAAETVVIPVMTLKDGRVFHHVKVMTTHALTLNIVADEGMAQINKTSLPPELAAQYLVDNVGAAKEQKAAEVSAEVARKLEEEHHKQVVEQQKRLAEENEKKMVFSGVRIISFTQMGEGAAVVELHNESDLPVTIPGQTMVARTSSNQVFPGYWISKMQGGEKRFFHQITIAGNSAAKVPVLFNGRKQISITEVFWKPAS